MNVRGGETFQQTKLIEPKGANVSCLYKTFPLSPSSATMSIALSLYHHPEHHPKELVNLASTTSKTILILFARSLLSKLEHLDCSPFYKVSDFQFFNFSKIVATLFKY